jgi:serine phosphatase RsbU (regulator of sigma subunit)
MMMSRDRRGADLLDDVLGELEAFTGSSNHQDDVTVLTLNLAEDLVKNNDRSTIGN